MFTFCPLITLLLGLLVVNLDQGSYVLGKSQGKFFFSRSGNCQGILESVREFLKFVKMSWICQGIFQSGQENVYAKTDT